MTNFIKRNRTEIAMTVGMSIVWLMHMYMVVAGLYFAYVSHMEGNEDWWVTLITMALGMPGACILPKIIKDEFIAKIK